MDKFIDKSEPAFPTKVTDNDCNYTIPGMTLRDYFAGQALGCISLALSPMFVAATAYEIADAMLEARRK